MTAKYWTTTSEDMWGLTIRTVFDFKNLETGELVSCDNMHDVMDANLLPVTMPKVKPRMPKAPKSSSKKYKGVSASGKKFKAQLWDGKSKKVKHLGTFDSELLAAAAVQEELGNHKEARRLRNEHEEGDPPVQKRPMEE